MPRAPRKRGRRDDLQEEVPRAPSRCCRGELRCATGAANTRALSRQRRQGCTVEAAQLKLFVELREVLDEEESRERGVSWRGLARSPFREGGAH